MEAAAELVELVAMEAAAEVAAEVEMAIFIN